MGPQRLVLARSRAQVYSGAFEALMCVGCGLGFAFLMAILNPFTGGGMAVPAVTAIVSVLVAAVILWASMTRGYAEIGLDELVIRNPGTRALRIPRSQVAHVMIDDGSSAGEARFATGDPAKPFLWKVGRGRSDLRPNVALVLDPPLGVTGQTGGAVTTDVAFGLPFLRRETGTVFLAIEDLAAVSAAFAAWPVERPGAVPVLPAAQRPPHGPVPQGFMVVAMATAVVAMLATAFGVGWLLPAWLVAMVPVVAAILRRHRAGAAAAMAAAGDDPVVREAVRANWGAAFADAPPDSSFGPPGS